jgi:hypothetical protein
MPSTATKTRDEPPFDLKVNDPKLIDPKQEILDKLGDLSWYEICNNEVLIAIYQRPEMTAGGIVLPRSNLQEDLYQAKAHLVVRIGPSCDFPMVPIKLYDWVAVRPADGWAVDVNGRPGSFDRKDFYPCRMMYDKFIRAKISDPRWIW